ncbi:MAG: ClpX C4-type zinc finger protein [Beijerinckiaceae bacterium]
MTIRPRNTGVRIKAAMRMLFRGGDNGVVCSFCGRDRYKVDPIIAGPGVAICRECAEISLVYADHERQPPIEPDARRTLIAPVLFAQEKLSAEQASRLEGVLHAAAAQCGCALDRWTVQKRYDGIGDTLSVICILAVDTDEIAMRDAMLMAIRTALGLPPPDSLYLADNGPADRK